MKGFHQQLCPKLQTCPQTPCEWGYHHKKWSLCWLYGPHVILSEGCLILSLCFFSTQLFSLCLRHCGSLAGNQYFNHCSEVLANINKGQRIGRTQNGKQKLWRRAITKNMLNKRNISVHGHVPQPKTCIYWIQMFDSWFWATPVT